MRGWVKVRAYTREPTDILNYSPWYIGSDYVVFDLKQGRRQGHGLVAQLSQIPDRDAAVELVGKNISIPVTALPQLPRGEYYWIELTGLTAITVHGVTLGIVESIQETGANDVLVISGESQRLVPYTREIVRNVDLERGEIELDWDPEY